LCSKTASPLWIHDGRWRLQDVDVEVQEDRLKQDHEEIDKRGGKTSDNTETIIDKNNEYFHRIISVDLN
jgi:hypothetical protein